MKDVVTPVSQEEVKTVIKGCLQNAALLNYQRISEEARIEGGQASISEDGPVFVCN